MSNIKKIRIGNCTIFRGRCEDIMANIAEKSIDSVITDPPYLYLKHKLDVAFDEERVFGEWKRLLKATGLIAFFGRGDAFFRWNLMLGELGFKFKETAVWEKENASNFLGSFLRIHEDISFRSLGLSGLNKRYIDYLEYNINKNSLDKVIKIWKNLRNALKGRNKDEVTKYIELGVKEFNYKSKTKYKITASECKSPSREVNLFQTVTKGKIETSIMRCKREQYKYEHPTQKPVALMERLILLCSNEGDTILDSFMGGGSTAIACINTKRKFIGIELDDDYFDVASKRIIKAYEESEHEKEYESERAA